MTRRNKIIYWIATVWMCLGMVSTGMVQLLRAKNDGPGSESSMIHLGYPVYLLALLGILKLLGVIAVLIPKFPMVKEWAYAGFFFLLIGALYSHIASGDAFMEIFPSLLLLVLAFLSWYFRPAERKIVSVNA